MAPGAFGLAPHRGPAARLGDEADGAGERCAGWRF